MSPTRRAAACSSGLSGPDSGKGAAGKWTDAATGEHGDLLDLIALNRGLDRLRDALDEARTFLSLPRPDLGRTTRHETSPAPRGSPESARRLFAMSQPISGTIAEAYLRRRGITALHASGALRFHPRCYYRPDADAPTETWPALIAAVTDLDGRITGAHRTWLDPSGRDKAPIDTPRRAMGHLLGHGVRFGVAHDVMAAGEGIETMLSLRGIMPTLPMVAALSANHLAAILFPAALRRLYVARDSDPAGDAAVATLERPRGSGRDRGADAVPSTRRFQRGSAPPRHRRTSGSLRVQLAPEDVVRFMDWATAATG